MANEIGDGCNDLSVVTTNDTMISGIVSTAAGSIDKYRCQFSTDPISAHNIEFAIFTESSGDFSTVSNTDTGVIQVTTSGGVCQEFVAGVDYTISGEASVGDYVGCWYQMGQEAQGNQGSGYYRFNDLNVCGLSSQTPTSTDSNGQTAVGADVSAGPDERSASIGGTLTAITASQDDDVLVDSDLVGTLAAITSILSNKVLVDSDIIGTLPEITSLFNVVTTGDNGFVETSPTVRYGTGNTAPTYQYTVAQKFVAPGSGNIQLLEIGVWLYADAAQTADLTLVVYTHDSGNNCPEAIVANSQQDVSTSENDDHVKVSHSYVTKPQLTGGDTYWFAYYPKDSVGNVSGEAAAVENGESCWKGPNASVPSGDLWHTHTDMSTGLSLYAVYEEAPDIVSATVGGLLSAITASQDDDVLVDSDLVATLPALTSLHDAEVLVTSELIASLEAVVASISSEVLVDSNVVATLQALTASLEAALLVDSTITGTLADLISELTAEVLVDSDVVGSLGALTGIINVETLNVVHAAVGGTLSAITAAQDDYVLIQKDISALLAELTSSEEAKVIVEGVIAANLEAIVASINASTAEDPTRVVTVAGILAAIVGSISSNVLVSGEVAAELASITGLLEATALVQSNISATLVAPTASLLVGCWCGNDFHVPHSLPDATIYGSNADNPVGNGDGNHKIFIRYTLPGAAGTFKIDYDIYDMDFIDEVEIFINGIKVGDNVSITTPDESWGSRTLYIPDSSVLDSGEHCLSFENRFNRDAGNNYLWAIKNVSYTVLPTRVSDVAAAIQALIATIEIQILVQGDIQATLASLTAYARAKTTFDYTNTNFPIIHGGGHSILGG